METILITGGTGLIGSKLIPLLMENGYEVRLLSRSPGKYLGAKKYQWNLEKGQVDPEAIQGIDHIIHLVGATVGKRWTSSRKKEILESRVRGIELIQEKIGDRKVKSFISASGTSIYGSITSDKTFTESDALVTAQNDFLADVSIQWEKAADLFQSSAERVIKMRTPIVLANKGSLMRMVKPIKMGIGSPLGSGTQFIPWVHIDDLCQAYLFALKNNIQGPFNIVAAEGVTNADFIRTIASTLGRKLWAPKVPSFVLKLLFGEMAVIIFEGSKIDGSKISEEGFSYQFNNLEDALSDILK